MRNYYYAVKRGFVPGVYTSWQECQKQTKGFPNALFKKFDEEDKAYAFLNDESSVSNITETTHPVDAQLYVDGSWNESTQTYGWGYVLVVDDVSVSSGYGKGSNPKYVGQHQIGGEVVAVLQGLNRAVYKEYHHVEIVYDYLGIEMWATGEWGTKSDITNSYIYFLKKYNKEIDISFTKVKSHSGEKFNEEADRLAKKGANK